MATPADPFDRLVSRSALTRDCYGGPDQCQPGLRTHSGGVGGEVGSLIHLRRSFDRFRSASRGGPAFKAPLTALRFGRTSKSSTVRRNTNRRDPEPFNSRILSGSGATWQLACQCSSGITAQSRRELKAPA